MNDRREMNAQDQRSRRTRSLLLSLLLILALLMSLCCFMLLCAPLALSEEKQEWLEASMATKLRADYRPDEWAEMRRFAPLRPEVIDETAKDERALAAAPGTGLVPVAVVVASSGGLPFPSPSPTSLPVSTPQPSPTSQPSPTLPPTATSTPLPTSTVPPSPTAAPTATGTSPPTATPTSLPTATATTSPPTPTPTSPPPPPPPPPPETPTPTPTFPAPKVYSISPDHGDTKSTVSITNLVGENFLAGATARIDNGISSTDLISVTVISPTRITGTLDLSMAAGGAYDLHVTNPDLQSDMATDAFTVTIPITYSYSVTSTCSISVTDCSYITGTADNRITEIQEGGVITLDFGAGNGIMDGRGYDFVFYEWYYPACNCVELDWIKIELSEDGLMWHTVFNWGDGYNPPMDDNTNIASYSQDGSEDDNENIPPAILYGTPPNPPVPTGILIDINFLAGPPDAQYRYVRLSCPASGGDEAHVDGIERLH